MMLAMGNGEGSIDVGGPLGHCSRSGEFGIFPAGGPVRDGLFY